MDRLCYAGQAPTLMGEKQHAAVRGSIIIAAVPLLKLRPNGIWDEHVPQCRASSPSGGERFYWIFTVT